jgi:hypothetical protein
MPSNSYARFGTFDELEHVAADLMAQGYTQTDRFEERGPRQYFFGPEHPARPSEDKYVLLWESDQRRTYK